MNANIDLPDKLTFKRKEVERIAKLDGKVLDYWQKEFGGFTPTTNTEGEIFYTRRDIEFILKLKQWMIVEKMGKQKIKEMLAGDKAEKVEHKPVLRESEVPLEREKLKIIRRNLQEILTLLEKNDK